MSGQRPEAMSLARSGNDSDETEEHKTDNPTTLARTFSSSTQSWKTFGEQCWRLLFTAVLVGLVIVTLTIYDHRKAVTHDGKITFNTIITVLNLALGLNFFEAFKDMAKALRWRVLANRKFTARETDLILGGESLVKLFTLMRESMKKPLTCFVCAFWLALNLLAQASIAMMGLTYSMDNGVNSTIITTSRGNVSVPHVDCYYNRGACTTAPDQPPEIAQNEAHAYGELTQGLERCPYETDEDIFKASQDCQYFKSNISQEFAYRFAEYNPQDRRRVYPYQTKRLIKVSPGACHRSSPEENGVYYAPFKDEPRSMVVLRFFNGTDDELVSVDRSITAFDSTTYAYLGVLAPQNATASTVTCGPRCIWVYAIRWNGTVTNRGNDVFKCPISVSEVTNIDNPAHVVPNDTARMAAASIALSGRYTNPDGPMKHWQQYQLYPYGSYWETNKLTSEEIGSRMAEFAIGSLSAMADLNNRTEIPGTLPTLGFHLSVEWRYVIALAVCIVAIHCFLVGLICFIVRPVVIPGDSNLITAQLLRGLVGKIGDQGGLLQGKEIADAIQRETSGVAGGRGTIGYGVRDGNGGIVLEIGEGMVRRRDLPGGRFPEGQYA